ncbi:hypothetical protein M2347_003796 [Chryseobacterium sp. H1D6B]|uniref:M56 family metallopeptidase n=1 Tax=Chryseobacterium sp. H1D6B TaxID=2940588 RepID=UPI0015CC0164|nr:M56 family metallopeptidase [Chryseobacterium sp. H1D6B]MDH6254069.1 hypothetical protein [Chryseobacterium sp. H1D6B]
METVLLYFVKVIVCSGVMFLYYRLSLKDKTFHHYNRFYLLSAMLLSLLLPLIKVDDFTIEVNSNVYLLINKLQNFNSNNEINYEFIYFRIIFSALGLVSLYFLGRFIYGILKIQQLKKEFQRESFDGINFYHTNLTEAPFSYFKNLFWKNTIVLNSDIGKQILKHEMVHIEQKHSFDKIFLEIITSIFWFNPFFHIIKKEISLIHEYLADKKAVKQSDTKAFAQMLLASHFSGTQLPATSPFLSSNLKKRLKMLQKPKTKFGYARRIFALPVLFTVAFAYMVNAKNEEIKETNIAVEKAVSQIKKDTITPEINKTAVIPSKAYTKSDGAEKIADLGKKIQEKSKSLKEMKPESREFQKNVDEINALSDEINKIASSDDFKRKAMVVRVDGNNIKMKIDELLNSDDWKKGVKEFQEMPPFEFEFPDTPLPPTPPNAPNTPNAPKNPSLKIFKLTDMKWSAEEAYKTAETARGSAENAKVAAETAKKRAEIEKKRAKLNEKRAKLEGERAKLEGERAKLEAERRVLDGNHKVFVFNNTASFSNSDVPVKMAVDANYILYNSKTNTLSAKGLKSFTADDNMKIYINGKEVTKKELETLSPNDIANININKRNKDGNTSGEIKIQTK